jgi:hypothetical protein
MPLKPESAGFLATNSVFQAIVFAVVGLRFYSRLSTKTVGWDDWWVLIATVSGGNGFTIVDMIICFGEFLADDGFSMASF